MCVCALPTVAAVKTSDNPWRRNRREKKEEEGKEGVWKEKGKGAGRGRKRKEDGGEKNGVEREGREEKQSQRKPEMEWKL